MKCAINLIRFQRVDEGTKPPLLGKPKLITLPDVLCSQASRTLFVDLFIIIS